MPTLLLNLFIVHQFRSKIICQFIKVGPFLFPVKISLTFITIIVGALFQKDTKKQNMAKMRKRILHAMQKVNVLFKQNQFGIPTRFRTTFVLF